MGRPKHALILPGGRTMIEHVADVLRSVCRQIVIVGNVDELPKVKRIHDQRRDQSPLVGVEALLSSGLDSHYLICPCDVPLITAEVLRMLLAPTTAAATVFRSHRGKSFEPLPLRIAAEALPAVQSLLDSGERALWKLLKQLNAEVIDIPESAAKCLLNVNTPEEFAEINRQHAFI